MTKRVAPLLPSASRLSSISLALLLFTTACTPAKEGLPSATPLASASPQEAAPPSPASTAATGKAAAEELAAREAQSAPNAVEALRPYYDSLQVDLAIAPAGPVIAAETTLTRIAFGGGVNQALSQEFWSVIAAAKPTLFLGTGDLVTPSTTFTGAADLPELRLAYTQLANAQAFQAFRARTPMLAVWNRSDFGPPSAGNDFAFKQFSEEQFETFWDAPQAVRNDPGVQQSVIIGPMGNRVHLVMLDTSFNRTAATAGFESSAPLLGEAQWNWLAAELRKPADLRLIISALPILAEGGTPDRWALSGGERQRLYDLIGQSGAQGVAFLSGGSIGSLYRAASGVPYPLYELSSGPLNRALPAPLETTDPARLHPVAVSADNFGLVDIDWINRTLTLKLLTLDGKIAQERNIAFTEINAGLSPDAVAPTSSAILDAVSRSQNEKK